MLKELFRTKIPSCFGTISRIILPLFIAIFIGSLAFFDRFAREQSFLTMASVYYIIVQIYGHWIQIWYHRTKEKHVLSRMNIKCQLQQMHFQCNKCQSIHGPFIHFCPLCNMCSFKYDKHCLFVGNCVGFKNRVYFISFCSSASIGSLYALVVYYNYYRTEYPYNTVSVYSILLPVAFCQFIIGNVDYVTLLFSFLFYFLVVVIGFTAVLVIWQILAFRRFNKKVIDRKSVV